MAKSKNNKSQVKEEPQVKEESKVEEKNVKEVVTSPKVVKPESALYYFYSVGCGFCKKAEPIVDEFNKEGRFPKILKLDLADKDNQGLKKELEQKYKKNCGTPWFIDGTTGKQLCGFRDKDTVEKWLNGEDIPAPPRPKGPPPKLPFHGAPEKEVNEWKESYGKWVKENEHMPNLQPADKILERPRPKSDPPKPPTPGSTNEDFDDWGKKYESWKSENSHLPNLQPTEAILQRLKGQAVPSAGNMAPGAPGGAQLQNSAEGRLNLVEKKLDRLMKHLGVK